MLTDIYRHRIYKKIEEERKNYTVEYCPNNLVNHNFAMVNIIFKSKTTSIKVKEIMELEFEFWISKFQVPLLVMAFDDNDNKISLRNLSQESELCGYYVNSIVFKKWKCMKTDEFPAKYFSENVIDSAYEGLDYDSVDEKEANAKAYIRKKNSIVNLFNFLSLFYLVIAVIIAILGFSNVVIGFFACIYSVYLAIANYRKSKGILSKSEHRIRDEKSRMKHYFYHCELNPKGFNSLKADNYRNNRCK